MTHNTFTHGRQLLAFLNLDANSKEILTSIQQPKPLTSNDDLDPYVCSHRGLHEPYSINVDVDANDIDHRPTLIVTSLVDDATSLIIVYSTVDTC